MFVSDMISAIRSLAADKKGVTAVEYGVIATLIVVALVATVETLGTSLNASFQAIVAALP